jgi:excisionase family DNA binding protein
MSDKQKNQREFESIRELSERTGKCYRTIHRAIKKGSIKAVRLGASVMIPRREVEKILEKGF